MVNSLSKQWTWPVQVSQRLTFDSQTECLVKGVWTLRAECKDWKVCGAQSWRDKTTYNFCHAQHWGDLKQQALVNNFIPVTEDSGVTMDEILLTELCGRNGGHIAWNGCKIYLPGTACLRGVFTKKQEILSIFSSFYFLDCNAFAMHSTVRF